MENKQKKWPSNPSHPPSQENTSCAVAAYWHNSGPRPADWLEKSYLNPFWSYFSLSEIACPSRTVEICKLKGEYGQIFHLRKDWPNIFVILILALRPFGPTKITKIFDFLSCMHMKNWFACKGVAHLRNTNSHMKKLNFKGN